MNRPLRTARGQPLLVLCVILGSWVLARAAVIEFGAAEAASGTAALALVSSQDPAKSPPDTAIPEREVPTSIAAETQISKGAPAQTLSPVWQPQSAAPKLAAPQWQPEPVRPQEIQPAPAPAVSGVGPVPVKVAIGHQLLWMAALSQLPSPDALGQPAPPVKARNPAQSKPVAASGSRWSGDGWLLWRRDGTVSGVSSFLPSTYGASQGGAVIRYRLAPASGHRPALYLRATSALEAPRGEEAALGLSFRPLPGVPVAAMVEARATRFQAGTKLRPAAALVSEFPALGLPLKVRGEAYVQAGYVGGHVASAFVDGQLKVDRSLLRIGKGELRAGGGVWGGAQEGASRLDAGPSATLGLQLGKTNARLAMDWRFRLAGDAAPKSGPAITLSAGF